MFGDSLVSAAFLLAVVPGSSSVTFHGGPTYAGLCYQAAKWEHRLGYEDCDRAMEEQLSRHDRVGTHVNRGILRMRNGANELALADFDAAIALDPDEPEAYINKASLLLRWPDGAAMAKSLYTLAIVKKTRELALAYFGRGLANERLGNVKLAYLDFKKANETDPQWDRPLTELARFTVKASTSPK